MPAVKEILGRYKIYFIGVGIAALGAVAATFLFGGAGATSGTATAVDDATSQAEREMLDELLALRAIRLSESLFANPLFTSMVDFSKPLTEQPVGRSNPFAPIFNQPTVPTEATRAAPENGN